jgi:hypothetical protein
MSRSVFNLLLDTLLLVVFCALLWCAAVVRFIFPRVSEADGWQLWGLDYQQWANAQFGILAVLALGILLHVMLHWSWVCGIVQAKVIRGKKGKVDEGMQTIYGVGLLIVLVNIVGLAIAAAALSIRAPY